MALSKDEFDRIQEAAVAMVKCTVGLNPMEQVLACVMASAGVTAALIEDEETLRSMIDGFSGMLEKEVRDMLAKEWSN